jgi:hypothetical protein
VPRRRRARLRAARLDHTYDDELRKLHRVELLILDDLALHPRGPTETSDFYELVVERHRQHSTITTSNRDPAQIVTMMADPLLAQSAFDRLQSAAFEHVVEATATDNGRSPPSPAPPTPNRNVDRQHYSDHPAHHGHDERGGPYLWQTGGSLLAGRHDHDPSETYVAVTPKEEVA